MVPSQQCHVCWISSFQQHEQCEDFKAVVAPVHKVPHEYVICSRDFTACGEEFEQIMELAVNIATDLHPGLIVR